MVDIVIEVPEAELVLLRETLRLSKERQKDPMRYIQSKSMSSCVALASSTVEVSSWKELGEFAGNLGVESPV